MDVRAFSDAIGTCSSVVHDAVSGKLRVPDFEQLRNVIKKVYAAVLPNTDGNNADYIPQLVSTAPYIKELEPVKMLPKDALCWARPSPLPSTSPTHTPPVPTSPPINLVSSGTRPRWTQINFPSASLQSMGNSTR